MRRRAIVQVQPSWQRRSWLPVGSTVILRQWPATKLQHRRPAGLFIDIASNVSQLSQTCVEVRRMFGLPNL